MNNIKLREFCRQGSVKNFELWIGDEDYCIILIRGEPKYKLSRLKPGMHIDYSSKAQE